MNKKAMIMLHFCAIGFLVASVLFLKYSDSYIPSEDLYLGEKQIAIFETYQEADADIYYIQHSALLCSQKATKDNFESEFESCMNAYLYYLKFTSNDFQITYTSSQDKTTIVGTSSKQLIYIKEHFTYKINPYFKVEVAYALAQSQESNLFV